MSALIAAPPGDQAYTVVYILVAVMAILGGGGLLGMYKWAKRQGVRDTQIDRVIAAVLPDANGKGGLTNRLDDQDRKLDAIKREATPNGGNTRKLGDIAQRTERKVDDLSSKLDQHIGASDIVTAQIDARLKKAGV